MKPIFALGRILGNELPPRDVKNGRLNSLRHLVQEPPLCGVIKFWIINRVWNPELAAAYRKLLSTVVGLVHEIPFDPEQYLATRDPHEQLLYCPGINNARNEGLRIAFEEYGVKFAAIFDGDCGFTPDQWNTVSSEIFDDCFNYGDRQAYSVPLVRVDHTLWDAALADPAFIIPDAPHEPQLIISHKAWKQGLCYDPALAYGQDDKVAMLVKLGHYPWVHLWHKLARDDQCRSVGRCYHIGTGSQEAEANLSKQWQLRLEAIARLPGDITRYYRKEPA